MTSKLVVVVGTGPAGLSAATALRKVAEVDVLVLEREDQAGGIPRHSDHLGYGLRDLKRVMSGPRYAAALVDRALSAGVQLQTGTTATRLDPDLSLNVTSARGQSSLQADAVVVATGCRERPRSARLVPGDRPAGVMTTGQLQQLVHLHHRSPGSRAVIVGAEHVSYSAVLTLAEAGCSTVAMVTPHVRPATYRVFDLAAKLRYQFPVFTEFELDAIVGRPVVKEVVLRDRRTREVRRIECDLVVFTGDWIADSDLVARSGVDTDPSTTGARVDSSFHTDTPGVFGIGNAVHPAETADVCGLDGHAVAADVDRWLRSGSWPSHGVNITATEPLLWVWPSRITSFDPPARGKFALRATTFQRAPQLTVSQGDRTLWQGRLPWLAPDRPLHLTSSWLANVALTPMADSVAVRVSR